MIVWLAALALFLLLALPPLMARVEIERHRAPDPALPGTGGELAWHLLERSGVKNVRVELTTGGDHYDPQTKTVRLTEPHYHGASLAAVAVAAHEVAHALQDHEGYGPLKTRTTLVKSAEQIQKIGAALMLATPVLAVVTRSPKVGLLSAAAGLLTMGVMTLTHLVTLPVEWDASFRRALPMLREGGYLPPEKLRQARGILRACALTYLSGSVMSLLNVGRWITILRR